MKSPPSILWGCVGSLDMLGYEETKLPTSSQEMVLFRSLLDLKHPWGSLGRIYGCIEQGGEFLAVLRDRLEN